MPLTSEAKRAYMRRYAAANREQENARCRAWYQKNKARALQQRQCFRYDNLQPLWGPENMSKGAKMPVSHQKELV